MIRKLLHCALILFFTTQSLLFAQVDAGNGGITTPSVNSNTATHPNRQYFLVTTVAGSLKGLTSQLKQAFTAPHFVSIEIDEATSILKIVSNKGTKIEDVKAVMKGFNLFILDYKEEYTNSFPGIFTNH